MKGKILIISTFLANSVKGLINMDKYKLKDILNDAIEHSNYIKIERVNVDGNPIECIPLAISKRLLLVQYLYDFLPDGYKILRLKDITFINCSEQESFIEKILKEEGIHNQIQTPELSIFDNWTNTIKQLFKLNRNIIIECESSDYKEFYIGKIIGIKNYTLSFFAFDSMGRWDEQACEINYKDITSITFGDRYSNIISNHLDDTGV